jgi:hypothetical protein
MFSSSTLRDSVWWQQMKIVGLNTAFGTLLRLSFKNKHDTTTSFKNGVFSTLSPLGRSSNSIQVYNSRAVFHKLV